MQLGFFLAPRVRLELLDSLAQVNLASESVGNSGLSALTNVIMALSREERHLGGWPVLHVKHPQVAELKKLYALCVVS